MRVQTAPEVPAGATVIGRMSPSTTITGALVLKPRDDSALTQFIASATNKDSATYHHYLAPGAFAGRFGPLRSTVTAAKQTLGASGLHVTSVADDNLLIDFTGTARQAEKAFNTGLLSYRLANGSLGHGTTSAVSLPSTIAPSVTAVLGLDDLLTATTAQAQPQYWRPGPPSVQHTFPAAQRATFPHPSGSANPCALAQSDAESSGGLTDDQIAHAYGAFNLYGAGDFGSGQHIAVFELEPFLATDIETFDTCYFGATEAAQMSGTDGDLTGSRLTVIPVDGGELQPGPGSVNDESTLDIEDVSALAPESSIDVYEAPNTTWGLIDNYADIINADHDQEITSSWFYGCEQLTQVAVPGLAQVENILFQQAAAQGESVYNAAGDTADDTCNTNRATIPPNGQNLLSVADTAAQPYVVAVGGTTIDDTTEPPSERVWNDGAQWGGGGGGISEAFTMPAWQRQVVLTSANATDVTNAEAFETSATSRESPFATPTFCDGTLGTTAPCREVPDVSAQADEFTGSITIYGQSLGYGDSNGWATIGGTSSATPIWAALEALINASPGCAADTIAFGGGEGSVPDVGFVSPILYGIAANPTAYAASFNDITVGNNDQYGLDNGLVFPAHAGYDMASGLGSPKVAGPNGQDGLAYYMCVYAASFSPPAVTSLTPSSGSTAGSETVVVAGSGFGTSGSPLVKGVQVGSAQAASFQVVNNTTLDVTVPPATQTPPPGSPSPDDGAGPAMIVVVATNGEVSRASAAAQFEYVDENVSSAQLPSVSSIGPFGGSETDPGPTTIWGSGFAASGANEVTSVTFGGVAAASFTVVRPYEIQVTPPKYSSGSTQCTALPYKGENATNDICQVDVVVSNANGASKESTILPPYEGSLTFDSMGAEVAPSDCGCEIEQQPTEYDYAPAPIITSVSTGTVSSPDSATLASEFGGATTNTVVITGKGMNQLTLAYLTLGSPANENSTFFESAATGTSLTITAPPTAEANGGPTVDPYALPVGFTSLGGVFEPGSNAKANIVYAGIPTVSGVVNDANSTTVGGLYGVLDTGGTPLTVTGQGLSQATGPLEFVDNITGFALATQYTYDTVSDTELTTESVGTNPGVLDLEVCTNTACSLDSGDKIVVYPPGNPSVVSVTPSSGSESGGTTVAISGSNLACVTGVFFGSVESTSFSNSPALLQCGSTDLVDAVTPPSALGTVSVTVTTEESEFTRFGQSPTTAKFRYEHPLVVTEQAPTSVKAGASFPVTITVENGSGQAVPSPKFKITLGITAGTGAKGATLTCKTNPVTTTKGVAVFSCTIDKHGTGYTLTAIGTGLVPAVTDTITVKTA
jgi:hypothetical protein